MCLMNNTFTHITSERTHSQHWCVFSTTIYNMWFTSNSCDWGSKKENRSDIIYMFGLHMDGKYKIIWIYICTLCVLHSYDCYKMFTFLQNHWILIISINFYFDFSPLFNIMSCSFFPAITVTRTKRIFEHLDVAYFFCSKNDFI